MQRKEGKGDMVLRNLLNTDTGETGEGIREFRRLTKKYFVRR